MDTYEAIDKMCAQCGDIYTPQADEIICGSCATDNAAIEELYTEVDYDSLSAWEKYAELTGQALEETTYAGHPLLVWPHVKEYKGKKIGKVALQIGLEKARALVKYHADVYQFAQYDGKDTALPSNHENSKSQAKPHIDKYKGKLTLTLPLKGMRPFGFGLMKAVLFAADIDQITAFVKRHDNPTPTDAQVTALVSQWVEDSITRTVNQWVTDSQTRMLPEPEPTEQDEINKGASHDAPTTPALDSTFTGDAAQLDMFGSVQLNLFPAIPPAEHLPMTSSTDMRRAKDLRQIAYDLAVEMQAESMSYLRYCELCFSYGLAGPEMESIWNEVRAERQMNRLPDYDEAQRRRDISLCADCGEVTWNDADENGDYHCDDCQQTEMNRQDCLQESGG